jgi:hypothetical protein
MDGAGRRDVLISKGHLSLLVCDQAVDRQHACVLREIYR